MLQTLTKIRDIINLSPSYYDAIINLNKWPTLTIRTYLPYRFPNWTDTNTTFKDAKTLDYAIMVVPRGQRRTVVAQLANSTCSIVEAEALTYRRPTEIAEILKRIAFEHAYGAPKEPNITYRLCLGYQPAHWLKTLEG